ncbi:hypothetical protein WJX73_005615 [Symbiochloris irregularis]|uniref:Uncharacterized protein n=1 Tax=Symbiochloris irregularis TaxID=706552 RepID=A0AAW1P0F2_9CHLO
MTAVQTPNGVACNLTKINLYDFVTSTRAADGSTFCNQAPTNKLETPAPANLPINPTTSSKFDLSTGPLVFNPATASGKRRKLLLQCGSQSAFAARLGFMGGKQSQYNPSIYFGIVKGTDGTTYFGTATDGTCLGPNYINVEQFLYSTQLSIADLCELAYS